MEEAIPIFGTAEAVAKFLLLIFGLWAAAAAVNVLLASWKARRPWLWGILGLLFGPAVLLVLIFKKSLPPEKGKPASSSASAPAAQSASVGKNNR